jgi:hypothetical protein
MFLLQLMSEWLAFDTNNVSTSVCQPSGVLNGRCHKNLYRLQGFGMKDEVGELISVEYSAIPFWTTVVSFLVLTELKLAFWPAF